MVVGITKIYNFMEGNVSYADVAAMVGKGEGCMNNWMNNPFMYLIWLAYMGNGGFGFGNRAGESVQNAEIMSQIASLRDQVNCNQNTNNVMGAINSNHDFLHSFNNAMNMGFAGTNATINQASTGNLLGQKDMVAQMASCCCDIKSNILNQTNQLQSRIDQLSNGVAQGFAQVGFLTQQQTNELNTNANANTQRILDHMCAAETQALRDKLAQASQDAQTATIIGTLKTSA